MSTVNIADIAVSAQQYVERGFAPPDSDEESGSSGDSPPPLRVLQGGGLHPHRAISPRARIHVVLAEPLDLVRVGVRSVLEGEEDVSVVGEVTSGEGVVALAAELRPDVVVMDIRLRGPDALAATQRLLTNSTVPRPRVLVLAPDEREGDWVGALRLGIKGIVFLDAAPEEFVRAVRVVAGGGAYLSPSAARRLLDELAADADLHPYSGQHPDSRQFEDLTTRERDLVLLAADGLSNGEIADRLVISTATVKTHISRAMTKLDAHDRAKLVALAYETGFVNEHGVIDARGH
jgi:DNA-binding NarL/FixJ family response regulator